MATTSSTTTTTTTVVVLLALVASLVGPLAPAADAAGETVFGANPSSASGPGTIASDKYDGDSTYRLVARATGVDDEEEVVALIDDGDGGTTPNWTVPLTLVDGTPDTYHADWDIPGAAQSGAGRVTFQVLDGTTVLAEERVAAKVEPGTYSVAITSPTLGGDVTFAGGAQTISGTASSDADAVALYYSTSPAGVAPTWIKCGDATTAPVSGSSPAYRTFSGTCTLDGASAADVTLIGGQASLTGVQGSGDAVRVNPNVAPDAADDAYATDEDATLTVSAPGVLVNDTDGEGHTLSASPVTDSGPSNGTLTLDSDGSFTYVPNADFNGTDAFQYRATDTLGGSDTATVTITVDAVNDPPVAKDDSYTTDEDTPLAVTGPGIVGNDSDADGDALTVSLVSGPSNGTLTAGPNDDGSFSYTPDANYTGPDSFTYRLSDGTTSETAVVSLTVGAVNDAPVATDDAYSTPEDVTRTVADPGVLRNDSDADGDTLGASLATDVANGTLTLNGDGSFAYTPDADFHGTDSFTYRASDGSLQSNPATVTITVSPVNDAPAATGDSHTTGEDVALDVADPGVLGNDSDADGDALTAVLVGGVSDGTLTFNADGSFSYTPDADFHGTDSFTYQADDGTARSNTVTVTITVDPANDAPVAQDDQFDADEDTTLNVSAPGVLADDTDPDGDALTAALVSDVSNGTLTLDSDGSFTYAPALNFNGTDSFTYRANDGTEDSNLATVTIDVSDVNDEPVAADDTGTTDEDTPLTVAAPGVLGNDSDPDTGDTLTAELAAGPSHGAVALDADGSYTYTPDADFNGTDTFTYQADDGDAESNVATVTITVNPVDDAPVAADDSYSTAEDTARIVDAAGGVTDNDTDVEGEPLTVSLVTGPSDGTLTLDADGSFTYTPDANFHGTDSFVYQADDGNGGTDTATVTITVNPANDAPLAVDDTATTAEDTTVGGDVLTNDTDLDGDPLTANLVAGPSHGTLTFNADRSFTYTPDADFHGTDSFTYQADDGTADSNVASVTITVDPVDDAPVAVDDAHSTEEDTELSVAAPGVLANDSDVEGSALTAVLVEGVADGALTLDADGSFTYTPDADFHGTDTFTYRASDGSLNSDVATVTITVIPVNDAPVAVDDAASTDEDTELTVAAPGVLGNDSDPDTGDTLTAELVAGPSHGAVALDTDGSYTYTPDANHVGTDTFTYQADDGDAESNVATVTITVNPVDDAPVNDAPAAVDDTATTAEDTAVRGDVLTNDTDADGDPLTATLVAGPSHGTLTFNADGSFTYTPKANFHGTDSFTYRASDGSLSSDVATVTITVTAVNDAPVAADDTANTDEDEPVAGNVLTNDRDPDGDALRAALASGPANGTVTLAADGTFTYTPDPGFSGTDRFTYRASDGSLSDTATVEITVRFGTEVDEVFLEHRVTRLWGEDRFATAVDTSRNSFPEAGSADVVVLARGDDPSGFADALAGTPLAVDRNGPLLITMPDSLHPATEAELRRVLPSGSTVIMLGLTAALHQGVEDRVEALGYEVERIGGLTRMETAIGIAGKLGHPDKLLIARGFDFPDALAAGAAAAHVDGAVLLGDDGRRNPSTEAYLEAHPDAQVWAIGGQMARLYPEATPVFGFDRVETAVAVADEFFADPPVIGLARMDKFPDSLTGGAHIGRLGGPMLLTHPAPTGTVAPQVKDHICSNEASILEAYVYGGTLAVSLGVERELLQRIMGDC